MAATLSIKVTALPPLANDTEIRRFAVKEEDTFFQPGGHAALSRRIAEAFSLVPGSFKIMYTDDEGDMCVTSSDAETQDAVRLAMLNAPPILRLTIKASGPTPVAASTQVPTSADPNLTLLLNSIAEKLPQAMASLPETVQRMLPNASLDVDATIAATKAAERAADPAAEGVHCGVTCDRSGMNPIVGNRYNLRGQNYDLCEAEFAKLDPQEQRMYVKIPPPNSSLGAAAGASGCGWGPRRGFCGRRAPHIPMGEKLAARFVRDVSIFDGTQMAPGTSFTKIWRIKNIGEMPWPAGARMLFVGGDQMSADMSVPVTHVGPVMPGEEVDVAVEMVAPTELGRYLGNWRLTGPHMRRKFGQRVWCHIQVVDPSKPLTESEMNDMFSAAERANDDADKEDPDADPDADGDADEAMRKLGRSPGDGDGGKEHKQEGGKPEADHVAWPASDDEVVLVCRPGEPSDENAPSVHGASLPRPASSAAAACAAAPPLSSASASASSAAAITASAASAAAAAAAASADAAAESKMPLPLPHAPDGYEPHAVSSAEEVGSNLFEMGFTDASLVAHVLEKNGANLDACMHDLSAIQGWESQLSDLCEMGFADAEKNKILLLKNKGELKAVVRELVSSK